MIAVELIGMLLLQTVGSQSQLSQEVKSRQQSSNGPGLSRDRRCKRNDQKVLVQHISAVLLFLDVPGNLPSVDSCIHSFCPNNLSAMSSETY